MKNRDAEAMLKVFYHNLLLDLDCTSRPALGVIRADMHHTLNHIVIYYTRVGIGVVDQSVLTHKNSVYTVYRRL